jgi:TRAP-type C4-dicarboxylate transport system permease small subunit
MAIVAVIAFAYLKRSGYQMPRGNRLLGLSISYAIVGAIASLVLLIIWMIWYEKSTGYSAGNAPVGWIFFYGPLSAALGQLIALIQWWPKKSS